MLLRQLTQDDADPLLSLDADPEVMRFLTGGVPRTREFIVNKALPTYLGFYDRFDAFGFWAAIEKTSGDFMGWFHLKPFEENPTETELGFRLKKLFWGHGFATEGSKALIKKGFQELGATKIVATTMALNMRSRRVLEKLGLRFEEEFVYPEAPFPGWQVEDCMEVKYGLTKERWNQQCLSGYPGD
jgi:RimJ/RimL family protein N-acetyltransferase